MNLEFVRVASRQEIKPGQLGRAQVQGRAILLANVDGTIYATDEMCTHEEFSLYLGALQGEYVSCSLHGSRFSVISGKPQEEPACTPLRTYPVRIEDDDVYVGVTS